ncbi:MAG: family 43 glycosylhydrolase [Polyangiaceae bacterium]
MATHSFSPLFVSALSLVTALACSASSDTQAPGSGGKTGAGGQASGNGGQTTGNGGQTTGNGGQASGNGGQSSGNGGQTGAGGSSGGASSGGSASGGASTGGSANGGALSGGSSSGGARGGSTNGGALSGGSSSGGARGGATSGGAATGGAATGGAATGGAATGGAGTGGTTTCTPPATGTKGTNPLFTDVFSADPAPLVYNCTFYITAGHDEGAGNTFTMNEWFIMKSTDMVHWTKIVGMKYTTFSWAHGNAWAGQMVQKGGKFYWYVPVEQGNGNGQMAIGVAVADSPEGPFKDAIGKPLVDDAFERSNMGFANDGATPYTIDPTVFVDDDGQAYLHYGGFSRMVNAKLGADMISISGTMKESTPSCYFEAPFLTKRGSTYYEIYACGVNPPTIDYATSTSPLGPWTHKGTVLPKMVTLAGQDAATNHSGVALLGSQWYIVYHVSNGPNGGGTYHREVAIDKLNFNTDGSIQQTTPTSGLSF